MTIYAVNSSSATLDAGWLMLCEESGHHHCNPYHLAEPCDSCGVIGDVTSMTQAELLRLALKCIDKGLSTMREACRLTRKWSM